MAFRWRGDQVTAEKAFDPPDAVCEHYPMKWDAGAIYDVLHDLSQICFFLIISSSSSTISSLSLLFLYDCSFISCHFFWNILLLLQYYCYYYYYPIFFVISQYDLTWGDMFLFCSFFYWIPNSLFSKPRELPIIWGNVSWDAGTWWLDLCVSLDFNHLLTS